MSRPLAIAIAILFCLIAGGYLGYQQGRIDGRTEIFEIRLKPTHGDMALLGTTAEVRDILLENDPLERAKLLSSKLQSLGPDSLDPVLDAYHDTFFELDDFEYAMLATWWARFDAKGAFDFSRGFWEATEPSVVRAVLREWASQDPEAAANSARGVTNPMDFSPHILAVVSGWDESGRPGLYEFVENLGPGFHRQRALMQIAQRRARRDGVEATFEWVENLPDLDHLYQLNAFRRVAAAAAQVDPEAAARFAEKHLGSAHADGVARRVGIWWVRKDPIATFAWLSKLPDGSDRDQAVVESYRVWLRDQPDQAMAWAAQQPIDPMWFQPALSLYARQIATLDIKEGIQLADKVHHPDFRLITIGRIARSWLSQDPAEAHAWLDQANLTEVEKGKILEPFRTDPAVDSKRDSG